MRITLAFIACFLFLEAAVADFIDYAKLDQLLRTSAPLANYPGQLQIHSIDLNPNPAKATLVPVASLPQGTVLLSMLDAPQSSGEVPEGLAQFLKKIERLVFKKQGEIKISFSKVNETRMFYFYRAIALNEGDFEKFKGMQDGDAIIKFVIAHELAHFILSSHEISHGVSPNNLVSAVYMPELNSETSDKNFKEKLTFEIMNPVNLAHAEVDALACLILKKLKEHLPSDPIGALKEIAEDQWGVPLDEHTLAALDLRKRVYNECAGRK